jgi:hypothetical protein
MLSRPASQSALPFSAIASYVRLGRKYDFRDLLSSAVKRLEFLNPTEKHQYLEWGKSAIPEILFLTQVSSSTSSPSPEKII